MLDREYRIEYGGGFFTLTHDYDRNAPADFTIRVRRYGKGRKWLLAVARRAGVKLAKEPKEYRCRYLGKPGITFQAFLPEDAGF